MSLKRHMTTALVGTLGGVLIAANLAVPKPLRDTFLLHRKQVVFYCNRLLTVPDSDVTRAVIVIHGSGRHVEEYFDAILDTMPSAADPARDWRRKTIVLAPDFQTKDDAAKKEAYWKDDWVTGGDSGGVSSFEVVDRLVEQLRSGNFPRLKWIVITGHSAGGQFVQRYAAFTDIDVRPWPNAALVKFVPANPSSYVYLNEYRFSEADNAWVVPHGKKSKDYNNYKYGLRDLSDYAKERGAWWARTHLPKRRVEVLAGTRDIQADESFDDSDEAMWQGDTRYERAQRFDAFMDEFYAPNQFRVTPVPGAGHDPREIYSSVEGQRALYFPD